MTFYCINTLIFTHADEVFKLKQKFKKKRMQLLSIKPGFPGWQPDV